MKIPEIILPTIKQIVFLLVRRKYYEIVSMLHSGPTEQELKGCIAAFPQRLIDPPEEAFRTLDIVPVNDREEYYVAFDLWTEEAGKSDLTLETRFTKNADSWECEIEGIHVL